MIPVRVIEPSTTGPLSTSARLRQLIDNDITAWGATVLRGIDPSWSDAVLDVARLIGSVDLKVGPELSGPPVMDVRFDPIKAPGRQQTYFTSDAFCLHTDLSYVTDPPKYLLMHCVQHDADGGGVTLLADCRIAFGAVSNESRSILSQTIFKFDYPPSLPPGGGLTQAIHETTEARQIWRYRPDRLQYPAWAQPAVGEFDQALRSAAASHLLVAGDLMVVDNHRTAHGRTAFRADGRESQRHLRRSYAYSNHH